MHIGKWGHGKGNFVSTSAIYIGVSAEHCITSIHNSPDADYQITAYTE